MKKKNCTWRICSHFVIWTGLIVCHWRQKRLSLGVIITSMIGMIWRIGHILRFTIVAHSITWCLTKGPVVTILTFCITRQHSVRVGTVKQTDVFQNDAFFRENSPLIFWHTFNFSSFQKLRRSSLELKETAKLINMEKINFSSSFLSQPWKPLL